VADSRHIPQNKQQKPLFPESEQNIAAHIDKAKFILVCL